MHFQWNNGKQTTEFQQFYVGFCKKKSRSVYSKLLPKGGTVL